MRISWKVSIIRPPCTAPGTGWKARIVSAARKIIVEIFEEAGLLDKIEPHKHMVPHGDRGGVPIEPRLTEQW